MLLISKAEWPSCSPSVKLFIRMVKYFLPERVFSSENTGFSSIADSFTTAAEFSCWLNSASCCSSGSAVSSFWAFSTCEGAKVCVLPNWAFSWFSLERFSISFSFFSRSSSPSKLPSSKAFPPSFTRCSSMCSITIAEALLTSDMTDRRNFGSFFRVLIQLLM